jgi:hypothetical protein
MWMDAADDTTFSYSSGTTVSQWRDKSGFNYHMVPKVNGPTRSVFLNSRKVLAFTAVQTIGNDVIDLSSTTSTVFVVSRYTSGTNQRVLTCNLDSGGGNWLLGHWGGYVNQYYAEGWVSYQVYGNDTVWRVYMGDYSGPPAGANTDLANIYSNGTAIVTNSTAASGGLRKLGINYYSNETSTCEVAEIIVFNRVLTVTERRLVHTYLGQKWEILNTDRSIIDLAGNNDNGLLGNGTVANMPVYNYYNKGGLRFNSSFSNYVISPNTTISGSQTFCVWAVMTGKQNSPTGVLSQHDYVSTANFGINILTSNQLAPSIGYTNGTREYQDKTTTGVISYNQIFNVVLVYNAGLNKIYWYINGVFDSEYSLSLTPKSTNWPIGLGRWDPSYDNYYFDGTIFSALVYNKALSPIEVAQNYEAQKSKFTNTIVQQGLVLNLDAGNPYSYGGAGTTWYDVSGNSNSGTLTNGPTYNSDAGGNIVFDGSNDYVSIPSAASIKNTSTLSLEGWVFISSAMNYYGGIIGKGISDSQEEYCLLVHSVNSKVYMDVGSSGGPYTDATYSFSLNTWYHIIGTHERTAGSSSIKIYINGSLLSSTTVNPTNTVNDNATNVSIGSRFNGGTSVWNGKIATARIYTRTLSAAEVLQNYNATKGRFGL